MSTQRVASPLDADLEEDTDLPQPLPGLIAAHADYGFDPPTLPGIVAPHRRTPLHGLAEEADFDAGGLDEPLDPTVQMDDAAARKAPALGPEPSARREPLAYEPTPLPLPFAAPGLSLAGYDAVPEYIHSEITTPTVPPRPSEKSCQTLPELSHLPPLPPLPEHDSLLSGLRYSRAVYASLRKRRRLHEQLAASQRAELAALDRLLVRLGQRAYADKLDVLSWHPLFAGGWSSEPAAKSLSPEQLLRRRAELAATRLQALAQVELGSLHKREAVLESELRQRGLLLRHRHAVLLTLTRRAAPQPAGHPLHQQRLEAEIAVAQAVSEVDELAQRLGYARAERLVQARIYTHAQAPAEQLVVALSTELATAQRRTPHLLVLGSLLASAGFGGEPPRPKATRHAADYADLWQKLAVLTDSLALRQTLFSRLELDRQSYDRDAIRRTGLALCVIAAAALCSAALVFWVLSAG